MYQALFVDDNGWFQFQAVPRKEPVWEMSGIDREMLTSFPIPMEVKERDLHIPKKRFVFRCELKSGLLIYERE